MQKIKDNIDELTDSHLLYAQNPPAFLFIILFTIFISCTVAFIWSFIAVKTYIVKCDGTIESYSQNYIMSSYTGEIIESRVSEGDYVKKGDTLFTISSTELDLQAQQLKDMIMLNNTKIDKYEELIECIKNGENSFSDKEAEDLAYYYQYETYIAQVNQKKLDVSSYLAYDYSDEQIENLIEANDAVIAEIYYGTLKSISDEIIELKSEIASYEVQLSSINNGQKEYSVVASASGFVHMDTEYKTGMVVQAATVLGNIVEENKKYYVAAFVNAVDMPLIHLDDNVEIELNGLTQTIYGTLSGKVSYIASKSTITDDGKSNFLVKIELDNQYLVSNKGNKVNISNGMSIEGRIQYDEMTYFEYILESLGVLIR